MAIKEKILCVFLAIAFYTLSSLSFAEDPIVTESTTTSTVTTDGEIKNTIVSPPPSAISPQISANTNSDLCTVGVAGAVQTQILGISMGSTTRDLNCEKLKNAKTLYDMGMKVAAVSVMCQDKRVFDAMMNAGTPCPYDGMIGADAKAAWKADQAMQPEKENVGVTDAKKLWGVGSIISTLGLLLLL
jgi:hypothetical protein